MQNELELAEGHVRRGREIVDIQRQIIARLRASGGDVRQAQALLHQFEASLGSRQFLAWLTGA